MNEVLVTQSFPVPGGHVTVQGVPALCQDGAVVAYRVSVSHAISALCRAAKPGDTVAYDPTLEVHPPPFIHSVRAEMERQGVSQAELARRLGVPPSQVSRWFARTGKLEHRSMNRIADALNCDLSITLTPRPTQETP